MKTSLGSNKSANNNEALDTIQLANEVGKLPDNHLDALLTICYTEFTRRKSKSRNNDKVIDLMYV